MWRTNRWRAAVVGSMVLSAASVTGLAPVGMGNVAQAGPGDTGRITLEPTIRVVDTRTGSPIAANVVTALPTGVLKVTVLPTASPIGDADVFACAGPADAEPTFRLQSAGTSARAVVSTPDVPLCLKSTVPVHLVVDRSGTITSAPFAAGLQYQPLALSEIVLESDYVGGSGLVSTTFTLPRTASVPATVGGATYSVDISTDTGGPAFAEIHRCGEPSTGSTVETGADGFGLGISNIALAASQQACLTVRSTEGGFVEVTLLGTLNTTGPDPTRLPPGTTSRQDSIRQPGFVPITPERAFDTRTDGGGKLLPTEILEVDLFDYITPFSTAVTMNVTVTGAEAAGFLTVWPCDEDQPNASNLNFEAGVDVPNLVTVRLSGPGTVCINGSATTHVLGDIAGVYEFGDGVGSTPLTPTRILDTRRAFGGQLIGANGTIALQVAGRGGIPASGVEAATMNVTATGSQADGYMTVWPCDQPRPEASNLNFRRGIDVPNLVTVKLSAAGTVCLFSTAATHVIADAAMYFSATSTGGFIDVTPDRVLDTRVPIGQPMKAKLRAGSPIAQQVAGSAGVPATGAVSVTMNITVANPETAGYLTVWPCTEPQPDASNLNFQAGVNVPNLVSVKLPPNGSVCFYSTANTDVLADVAGYTTDTPIPFWTVVVA
jgi:hypothetical protein